MTMLPMRGLLYPHLEPEYDQIYAMQFLLMLAYSTYLIQLCSIPVHFTYYIVCSSISEVNYNYNICANSSIVLLKQRM